MAKEVVLEAGKIILKYFNNHYHIREKSHNNPVTTADLEADLFLRKTLLAEFPEDGWLSEETRDSIDRLTKKRVWIVDPLDGTVGFIRGLPEFVVSVALTVDQKPVVGVVYNPLTKELFSTRVGDNSYLNDCKIHCSTNTELKEATVYVSRAETNDGLWDRYNDVFKMRIISGSIAYKLVQTAVNHGDLTISLRPKHEWDICAADLIIQNAGGIVINRNLNPISYNNIDPKIPNGLLAGPTQLVDKIKPLFSI